MNNSEINIWSILIIISIAQGLFTISLIIIKRKNRNFNSWIFLFIMLFLIWLQIEFLAVQLSISVKAKIFYGTHYGSWFVLGPLYLFLVSSIGAKNSFKFKDLIHLFPFIITVLIIPALFGKILGYRQIHYGMLSAFDQYNLNVLPIQYLYSGIFVLQFAHFAVYAIIGQRTITNYKHSLESSYSGKVIEEINWLRQLGYYLIAILLFVGVFVLIFFLAEIYSRRWDYLFVLPMAILMYVLAYRLAEVEWPIKAGKDEIKYRKSTLTDVKARQYLDQLTEYMHASKPYLNNELRLQDLSESLNIPLHHLSQIINDNLNLSFLNYINQQRVEHAKQLIQNDKHLTLLEIAYNSGFNNKTSFVNYFRKYQGITPSQYRRTH